MKDPVATGFSAPEPSLPCPLARPEVERLKAYIAPLEGRRQMLRLDFNENTIGPSPLVAQALRNFSTDETVSYTHLTLPTIYSV